TTTATSNTSYIMVNKKRGFTSLLSVDNLASVEQTAQLNDEKKSKFDDLSNVNIIDVVSSEYFDSSKDKEEEKNEKETNGKEEKSKITCNGVEMIREKVAAVDATKNSKYVYDIYYTKNENIHLDLLYPNNFEIKAFSNYKDVDLVDD